MNAEKATKKPTVELIKRKGKMGEVHEVYVIMEELVAKHHDRLADAKIALAWRFGWRPNGDGQVKLGQAKKAGELGQELHGYDFVILLNSEVWKKAGFSEEQMHALIDHELCHCEVTYDRKGLVKLDKHDRPVWRMRKHDIEEFQDVVARHGCWQSDIEAFAKAALDRAERPLLTAIGQ